MAFVHSACIVSLSSLLEVDGILPVCLPFSLDDGPRFGAEPGKELLRHDRLRDRGQGLEYREYDPRHRNRGISRCNRYKSVL